VPELRFEAGRGPRGPKRTNWHASRRQALAGGLAPALAVLGILTLLPGLSLIVASFTPFSLVDPERSFTFADPLTNYRQLWHDPRFLNSVLVQAKLSAVTVVLQLAIGLGLALLLNARSVFVEGVRTIFLIPMVLPPIVVALIWKIIYTPDISPLHRALEAIGLPLGSLITDAGTALWAVAAADVWQWFPFTMLMILAALQMIPEEPMEAARIDGANRRQLFRHIVLPNIQATLVVAGLFRLIDIFKAFPLIYVLTDGGPGSVTEVANYYSFIEAFNFSYWGYASAIATVVLLSVFLLSWAVGRFGWATSA
jgi:multiple sugar transport system permease protein